MDQKARIVAGFFISGPVCILWPENLAAAGGR